MFFFAKMKPRLLLVTVTLKTREPHRPTSPPTILGDPPGATSAVESSPGRPATAAVRQPDDHDGTRGVGGLG